MEELNIKKDQVRQTYDNIAQEYESIFNYGRLRLLKELNYHIINSLLIDSKAKAILDGGGATGFLTEHLVELGYNVTVVDISENMIFEAKRKNKVVQKINEGTIDYKVADLENLNIFSNASFDFIIYEGGTLSYLTHPELALSEVYRILKPGGKALITAQNKYHFMGLISSINISKFIFNRSKVPSNLNDVNVVTSCFAPGEFQSILVNSGLTVLKLGSKLVTPEKMRYLTDELLEKDYECFQEAFKLEKQLLWEPSLAGVGRTLMALCEKKS